MNTGKTQFKKGHIPYNKGTKGYKHSGTFKKGHSFYGSIERIKNWGLLHKGKKLSKEHRKELSESKKGSKNPMWGRKGEKHHNWKKDRKPKRGKHQGTEYIEWRTSIFERDCYTCCICHQVGSKLVAHHIKRWADYPELRYDINNGITLCEECHKLTDNYGGKKGSARMR